MANTRSILLLPTRVGSWILRQAGTPQLRLPDRSTKRLGRHMPRVTITLTDHVRVSVQDVFRFVTAKDVLPKILLGYGPLPGVVSTSENTGPWHVPGSSRW